MQDYMFIGSSPTGEDCAQVGSANYYENSRKELKAFINQLRRAFGEEPFGARLRIKTQSHDFGEYSEVICAYDENNEEAYNYATRCESETPEYWDEEAKRELKEASTK